MDTTNQGEQASSNKQVQGRNFRSSAPEWEGRARLIGWIGFISLLVVLGLVVRAVIPFALTAVVFSYLFHPLVDFLERRVLLGSRGLAVMSTFLILLFVLLGFFLILVPPLVEQTISGVISVWNTLVGLITEPIILNADEVPFITETVPLITNPDPEAQQQALSVLEYINLLLQQQGFTTFNEWLQANADNININRETLTQFFNIGGGITSSLVGSVFSIAGSTIAFALNMLFFLTICASLLSGGRNIVNSMIEGAPDGYQEDVARLLKNLGGVWDGYVRGNLTLGLIMGVAMYTIAAFLGLPNPLFLAFVAGIMEFVPNLGPTIAMAMAGIVALVGGSATFPELNHFAVAGIAVIIWLVMQQLEATVLVPRIVGENLKLHPVIVILAVIWGGSFGGLLGVVVAPPLVASARIILQYLYGRLTGRPAFDDDTDVESTPANSTRIALLLGWLRPQRILKRLQRNQ